MSDTEQNVNGETEEEISTTTPQQQEAEVAVEAEEGVENNEENTNEQVPEDEQTEQVEETPEGEVGQQEMGEDKEKDTNEEPGSQEAPEDPQEEEALQAAETSEGADHPEEPEAEKDLENQDIAETTQEEVINEQEPETNQISEDPQETQRSQNSDQPQIIEGEQEANHQQETENVVDSDDKQDTHRSEDPEQPQVIDDTQESNAAKENQEGEALKSANEKEETEIEETSEESTQPNNLEEPVNDDNNETSNQENDNKLEEQQEEEQEAAKTAEEESPNSEQLETEKDAIEEHENQDVEEEQVSQTPTNLDQEAVTEEKQEPEEPVEESNPEAVEQNQSQNLEENDTEVVEPNEKVINDETPKTNDDAPPQPDGGLPQDAEEQKDAHVVVNGSSDEKVDQGQRPASIEPENENQHHGSRVSSRGEGGSSGGHVTTTTGGMSTDIDAKTEGHRLESQKEKERVSSAKPPKAKSLTHCLNLSWCFGVNKSCPALNMLYKLNADDPGRDAVLYTCSNVAVMYDFNENSQVLLQGHSHAITCTATSEDKRWLVTADSGRNASIIVWDTFTAIPVQTIFDPHPGSDGSNEDTGVAAITMTNDAKYIASVSSSFPQTVSIWDWTAQGGVSATATVLLNLSMSSMLQTYISFNSANPCQLVTNSPDQVVFYLWDGAENLNYIDPNVTEKDFNRVVGNFSQSIYAPGSKWIFTATSAGNVVVWAPDKVLDRQASKISTSSLKIKAFKLVRLQERAISVLTIHDQYVVTGDVVGCIKFYDNQLRMINWYQDFEKIGPINSVSFAYCPGYPFTKLSPTNMPTDATIEANKFPIKDFILSTITSKIGKVYNDGTTLLTILQEHDDGIFALAAHPSRTLICMGSFSGYIKIWDYVQKKVVCDLKFKPKKKITCLTYDPSGKFIAIGFEDGLVRVLDSLTLADELKQPFTMSKGAITHIKFAPNSKYLVTADKDLCVVVYKAQFEEGSAPFAFFGKNRAHYKEITQILFGVALENDQPRLMSIGKDRVLVEYDLEDSSEDDIKIASTNKIEQSAVPLGLAWYPPVMKEDFLITSNDQFKLKLYNSTTKMCRKTVLGPTYGSPVTKLAVLPFLEDPFVEPRYIAFATNDRVGLHRLPVTGNPHDAMVTVAHPQGIAELCCSFDAKYVFTAGGVDCTVQMWQVHYPAIEASCKLGGEDLIPFYDLMQGGREGELFKELEDYFYYAMIRSQGVNTMKQRSVSVTISIDEIPFVMRALGFYPTEQEIEDMLNEVKFSKYVETGQYVTDIDLNTFIKLYVNHRPAFGLNPELILNSFQHLGIADQNGQYLIDRDDFLEILQNRGEQLNDAELSEFISVLLGESPEGALSENKNYRAIENDPMLLERLPVEITSDTFSTTLLGFPLSKFYPNGGVPASSNMLQNGDSEGNQSRAPRSGQTSSKSVRLVTTGSQVE